jgi:outer membrane protein, heavy metal efflux system
MYRHCWRMCFGLLLVSCFASHLPAQQTYTWQQIRDRFATSNPNLRAGQIGVQESKAQEVTAFLRPNPNLTLSVDQLNILQAHPYQPFYYAYPNAAFDYLHERQHKRELRLESAQEATQIASSNQSDLTRTLTYELRDAFIRTLQAKVLLGVTRENLAYYDHVLEVNRERLKAGDISQVDLSRLELQRVQFQTDVVNGEVSLRTAKIQLQTILNDKTPVDQFDIAGDFDFTTDLSPLEDFRRIAMDVRPDLKAAVESVEKAQTDHRLAVANGSVDPTIGVDIGRNPPLNYYAGVSVSIPLRIFDRNQGEKLRTQLDIERNEHLREAAERGVLGDVDSAYATVQSTVDLLKPYKQVYLAQAGKVRETVSFAYAHGGASLLDFLDAQQQYRSIQLSYLGLVGAYLSAANQLNLSIGREVIQ